QRDVQRADGIVEARALRLGNEGPRSIHDQLAAERLELPEQQPEQRRLAAPVRPQHRDALAATEVEIDVFQHHGPAVAGANAPRPAVAGATATRLAQRPGLPILHPRAPPVKPRTSSFAFAASIPR